MSELTTALTEAFNVDTEEGSPDFAPVPKGQYSATATDAKAGPLKSGRGQAVSVTLEIADGEYAGRLIWDRIIIAHESAEAMKFGRRKFKDLADACGVAGQITDLLVLLHTPLLISVKIEEDESGEYAPKNRVTRYKKIEAAKKPNGGDGKADFDDDINF
jgi:hypothetical protein